MPGQAGRGSWISPRAAWPWSRGSRISPRAAWPPGRGSRALGSARGLHGPRSGLLDQLEGCVAPGLAGDSHQAPRARVSPLCSPRDSFHDPVNLASPPLLLGLRLAVWPWAVTSPGTSRAWPPRTHRALASLTQQMLAEHLLCAGHCVGHWRHNREQSRQKPCALVDK